MAHWAGPLSSQACACWQKHGRVDAATMLSAEGVSWRPYIGSLHNHLKSAEKFRVPSILSYHIYLSNACSVSGKFLNERIATGHQPKQVLRFVNEIQYKSNRITNAILPAVGAARAAYMETQHFAASPFSRIHTCATILCLLRKKRYNTAADHPYVSCFRTMRSYMRHPASQHAAGASPDRRTVSCARC